MRLKLIPGTMFHHDLHLMVFRPRGVITQKRLHQIVQMLEQVEDKAHHPFNRYCDLSKLDAIDVDFRTAFGFSLHRRLSYRERSPVKSAIYVNTPDAVRITKLHALLTDYSPLKVKMFEDLAAAAKWLNVPLDALELDPWADKWNNVKKA